MTRNLTLVALTPTLLWMLGCPAQQTASEAPAEPKAVAQADTALTGQAGAKHDCAEHQAAGKPCDCKSNHGAVATPGAEAKHDCKGHAEGQPCDCKGKSDCKGHAEGQPCDCKGKSDCKGHAEGQPCDCKGKHAAVEGATAVAAVAGGHECGGGDTKLTDDTVTTRQGEDGQEIAHVGAVFGEAVEVSVADLLAKPDDFAGKTVRVKGDVTAMCHHKRGWFAVNAGDQSGRFLRVLTAPSFLVPAGSIGKTGVAEGKVEVVEVAAGFAKHIAKDHKLGEAEKIEGNVKQVVIRATGADFI